MTKINHPKSPSFYRDDQGNLILFTLEQDGSGDEVSIKRSLSAETGIRLLQELKTSLRDNYIWPCKCSSPWSLKEKDEHHILERNIFPRFSVQINGDGSMGDIEWVDPKPSGVSSAFMTELFNEAGDFLEREKLINK
ncbi:MAG: hypothetical protein KQH63_04530 [Desulfobulbaceae bacterium]|nr:hypothetical protein [Desulfobulbaceae bacterium]